MGSSGPGRVRVERGIYRQPNGKYAVCWRHAGRLRSRFLDGTSVSHFEELGAVSEKTRLRHPVATGTIG
jgi:hypothetical protein